MIKKEITEVLHGFMDKCPDYVPDPDYWEKDPYGWKIKLTKTKNTNLYDFLDEMKEDIKDWWKMNMIDCKIDKKVVNLFKKLVFHEIIHYKIGKKYVENIDLSLELEKAEEGTSGFYYNASLKHTYPYKFNLPKYYPMFVFIEFKHFLFDIICDTFRLAIFVNLRNRLFKFLKCLISFKVRV